MHFDYEAAYWMIWMGAAGACAGSFINALTYRLPRLISVSEPRHSFCPSCDAQIRWRDNIPLVSYLVLRGRCRSCRLVISPAYPLVEGVSALLFMLLTDAFFVGAVRSDVHAPGAFGVTEQVAAAWPFLLAHVVLAAALLTVATIDIEEYYVDIRVTWTAIVVGVLCHAIGTSPQDRQYELSPRAALITLAALAGLFVSWGCRRLWVRWRFDAAMDRLVEESPEVPTDQGEPAEPEISHPGAESDAVLDECPSQPQPAPPSPVRSPVAGVIIAAAAMVVIIAWGVTAGQHFADARGWMPPSVRLLLVFALLFLALIGSSMRARPADSAIAVAIESERHRARKMALSELAFLSPALILAGLALFWSAGWSGSSLEQAIERLLSWPAPTRWRLVENVLWSVSSVLLAAGSGWAVRILFTLVLGKEALGLGDIHIMAAAGAVVGGVLTIVGFFFAAVLAVIGLILLLGIKRSRAIPYGPWLALGILAMVLLHDSVLDYLAPATRGLLEFLTTGFPAGSRSAIHG